MNQTTGLKVLAVVISVILWAYVRVTVGGVTRNSVTQLELRVPLETKGAGTSLIPYEKSTDTIKLILRGDSEVVTELREGLVRAYIDVENMSAGSAWPEVQVLVPANVEILDVDPASVNVRLSPRMVKEVPIKIDTAGLPKTGFKVGTPIFEPVKAKIEGPEELVSQVALVSGLVPVEGLGNTLALAVNDLKPVNDNGTAVMGTDTALRLDVREVRVTIPIEQQQTLETLPVLVDNVTVKKQAGYSYRLEVSPQYVQVATTRGQADLPSGLQVKGVTLDPVRDQVQQVEVELMNVDGLNFVGANKISIRVIPQKTTNRGASNTSGDT